MFPTVNPKFQIFISFTTPKASALSPPGHLAVTVQTKNLRDREYLQQRKRISR